MDEEQNSVVQNSISELWEYHNPKVYPDLNEVFPSRLVLTADVAKAKVTTIRKIRFIVNRAPWRAVLAWACWCVERALERDRSAGGEPHVLAWEAVRRSLRVAVGLEGVVPPVQVCKALAKLPAPSHAETAAYQVGVAAQDALRGSWYSFRSSVSTAVREAAEIECKDTKWMVDKEAREAEHVVQLTRLVEMVEVVNATLL